MNEHDTFSGLDARAAAAATDLQAAAAARPRPAFDPERSPSVPVPASTGATANRSVPRRTLAAVAAVAVLVVGGVIWAAARPDADDPGPATITTDAPRPFVLGSVPEGFSLAGAGEVTPAEWEAMSSTSAPLTFYGPAPDEPLLGVTLIEGFTTDGLGEGTEAFEVDGTKAYAYDDQGLGRRVVVVPKGPNALLAVSPTLERDELLELLGAVTLEGRRATVDQQSLPAGWSPLGEEPSVIGLGSAVAAMRGSIGPGSYVAYSAGDVTTTESSPADYQLVLVSSMPGDDARLHALELVADETRGATVRGHDALVGTLSVAGGSGPVTSSFVSWIERPGELIRVTAMGVSLDELVDLAESVESSGGEAWRDLVERSQLGEFDPGTYRESGGELVDMARGRFDDGTAWVLRVVPADGEDPTGPNASVDLQVALGGDSSSGSSSGSATAIGADGQPVEGPLGASTSVEQAGRTFGAGFVGADVDSVVLVAEDGTELGRAEIVSGLGRRAWVAEAVEGGAEVVARAADGTELGRQGFGDGSAPIPAGPTTIVEGPGD